MPSELEVDKEAVRVLVVAVGPREAARQMGLNENTVLQWTSRYGWLDHCKQPAPLLPVSMQKQSVIGVINPADALSNVMAERYLHTKLGQSEYLSRASRKLAALPEEHLLAEAQTGKALADMAAKVFPETSGQVRLSTDLSPLLDVDATYVPDTQQDVQDNT